MHQIQEYHPTHEEGLIRLAIEAWTPVFASVRETLGARLFFRLFGDDWREHQASDIRRALDTCGVSVAVAGTGESLLGFTAVDLPEDETHGEIYMLAVAPKAQRRGIGRALTDHAIGQIRAAGRELVMVNTGADPGHAAARAIYERAGFTPWPAVQYYMEL